MSLGNIRGSLVAASIALLCQAIACNTAHASPLTVGNLLVSGLDDGVLREYTTAGVLVQKFDTPDFASGFHSLRDITVGADGAVRMFNGTFSPQMTTLNASTGAFSNTTLAGWSTINNVSYGGISTLGKYTYVTDMATGGGSEAGIVRFDTTTGTAARFDSGFDYDDINIGLDGLLYASAGGFLRVFDPITMTFIRNIGLVGAGDVRGVAVDAGGNIYTADWSGRVAKFSSLGALLGSYMTTIGSLTDIDVSAGGELIVGSRFGSVGELDTSLTHFSSFGIDSSTTTHVAFITSSGEVPEPASLLLVAVAGLAGLASRRRK